MQEQLARLDEEKGRLDTALQSQMHAVHNPAQVSAVN